MGRYKTPQGSIVNVDEVLAEKIGSTWTALDGGSDETGKPAKSETPDTTWKIDELKTFAAERDVDLAGATKKDEILAAIAAAASSK